MPESIDDALLEWLELADSEREAALESLCQRFPDQAEDVRARASWLGRFGAPASSAPDEEPVLFGEYRLLEQIGGGGMGVVYRAMQETPGLRREVALKLVRRGSLLLPDVRERFRREAEAALRLDDPAICPVLDVGEVDGTPYLAMRLIPGRSLAQRLGEARDSGTGLGLDVVSTQSGTSTGSGTGPSGHAAAARLIEATARALHTAHLAGLIHRDVKPGNIMVTPAGQPVLLDFGLVHDVSEVGLTHTGEVLGTPTYMAPEQVRGEAVTPATDVYALGATLYECLALQPPFGERTRESLYHAIQREDPKPLTRFGVSRSLSTVVQAAMEKDSARRYPTAAAFAEDLHRALNHQPLVAKPAGPVRRLSLWCRRNPAATTAVAILAAASIVLGLQAMELKRQAVSLEQARTDAIQEFRTARDVVGDMVKVAIDDLADTPRISPVRTRMLQSALEYHQRFAAEHGDDPSVLDDVAWAWFLQARLQSSLGRYDLAREAIDEARRQRQSLIDSSEDPAQQRIHRLEMARIDSFTAGIEAGLGHGEPALRFGRAALTVLLEEPGPEAAQLRIDTWQRMGAAHISVGDLSDAVTFYVLAIHGRTKLESEHEDLVDPVETSGLRCALGGALQQLHLFDESETALRRALTDLEQAYPSAYVLDLRASALRNLGVQFRSQGRLDEALQVSRAAAELYRQLSIENPQTPGYFASLNQVEILLGNIESDADAEAGRAHYEAALAAADAMLALEPGSETAVRQSARSHYHLGLLDRNTDPARALEAFEASVTKLESTAPSDSVLQLLASSVHNASVMERRLGRVVEADQRLLRAVELKRSLMRAKADEPRRVLDLANGLRVLGKSHGAAGRKREAAGVFEEAKTLCRQLVESHPDVTRYATAQLRLWMTRTEAFWDHTALGALRDAASWIDALPTERLDRFHTSSDFSWAVRRIRWNLARLAEDAGDLDGARDSLEKLLTRRPGDEDARAMLNALNERR